MVGSPPRPREEPAVHTFLTTVLNGLFHGTIRPTRALGMQALQQLSVEDAKLLLPVMIALWAIHDEVSNPIKHRCLLPGYDPLEQICDRCESDMSVEA